MYESIINSTVIHGTLVKMEETKSKKFLPLRCGRRCQSSPRAQESCFYSRGLVGRDCWGPVSRLSQRRVCLSHFQPAAVIAATNLSLLFYSWGAWRKWAVRLWSPCKAWCVEGGSGGTHPHRDTPVRDFSIGNQGQTKTVASLEKVRLGLDPTWVLCVAGR